MIWCVSRERRGTVDFFFFFFFLNSEQTGCVNKEGFFGVGGVISLKSKYRKPQGQIRISHSLHEAKSHQMIQSCSTVACSAKNVLWGACLKPCIVLDRHVHSEGFTKRSRLDVDLYTAYMANRGWFTCIQLPPWIQWACVTHSQPLSGSRLAHHLWIFKWTRVQNSVLSVKSLPFSACLSQSLQCSLCCRVFPAPGLLCAGLGGPVWNVVRRGGGRPA